MKIEKNYKGKKSDLAKITGRTGFLILHRKKKI